MIIGGLRPDDTGDDVFEDASSDAFEASADPEGTGKSDVSGEIETEDRVSALHKSVYDRLPTT